MLPVRCDQIPASDTPRPFLWIYIASSPATTARGFKMNSRGVRPYFSLSKALKCSLRTTYFSKATFNASRRERTPMASIPSGRSSRRRTDLGSRQRLKPNLEASFNRVQS